MDIIAQPTNKVCYMILPQGIKEDLTVGLGMLSGRYGISIVVVEDVDWNDDLTPWPAEGVFRKAKPFGGHAAGFLDKLSHEIIPATEKQLDIDEAERTILGVSLSGLFAIWSTFNTDAFTNIISISGSLWYDGFLEWMEESTPSPGIKKVCMLLGVKEKFAKDKRMAMVEKKNRCCRQCHKVEESGRCDFRIS